MSRTIYLVTFSLFTNIKDKETNPCGSDHVSGHIFFFIANTTKKEAAPPGADHVAGDILLSVDSGGAGALVLSEGHQRPQLGQVRGRALAGV